MLSPVVTGVVPFQKPFPPELRAAFLDYLEPRDLLGYSLACRAFNAEAKRVLWKDYVFWFEPQGQGLDDACLPILRDPAAASRYIKSFTILMKRPLASSPGMRSCRIRWASSSSFWSRFAATLSALTSVTKFNLGESCSARAMPFRMLDDSTLVQFLTCIQVWMAASPAIRSFLCQLDFTNVVPLLCARPSLTRVALNCGWELPTISHGAAGSSSSSCSLLPPHALSNLEEFEGDALMVHTIALASSPHLRRFQRLSKLSVFLSWPSRSFGAVLHQCFPNLETLRVLQPPCHTQSMGERLRNIGPLPSVTHLEYAYAPSTPIFMDPPALSISPTSKGGYSLDSDAAGGLSSTTSLKGEKLNGSNIQDVLEPIISTFPSLRSCTLNFAAHPDDTNFAELLRDGPAVLARLCENGDFPDLERFVWNLGPGRRNVCGRGCGWRRSEHGGGGGEFVVDTFSREDRIVEFARRPDGNAWNAFAPFCS